MSTEVTPQPTAVATRCVILRGGVQGWGVRPAVARLASQWQLRGRVRNTMSGVKIEVEGSVDNIRSFTEQIPAVVPGHPRIDSMTNPPPVGFLDFRIESSDSDDRLQTIVPTDAVTCQDCLDETRSAGNRRYGFAFTSCVRCGPRYSILHHMPYDRSRTSMSAYSMCTRCLSEYRSASDRRFHCQTNCCPRCGPRLWTRKNLEDATQVQGDVIGLTVRSLLAGEILAMKGVGGYQLVCDATNREAIDRLRQGKRRLAKPLAVMVGSLEKASELCLLSELERTALVSESGPIVLGRTRDPSQLPDTINPGLRDIGLMLPTSSLHAIISDGVGRPLVVTSGNREGEPIEYEVEGAEQRLSELVDRFLHHDRAIVRPIDDSVVRQIGERIVTIRAARGIAPMTIDFPASATCVAVGGQQKVALAISAEDRCVLGPHLGDLGTVASRDRFEHHLQSFTQLYQNDPVKLVRDRHPDYYTSQRLENTDTETLKTVQHHHAHVVSTMAERGWLDRQVLGVAFDGTGLGGDNTIWGGEFLLCTTRNYQRVGHLRTFPLPGGEASIRQPWRVACALLDQALDGSGDDWMGRLSEGRCDVDFIRKVGGNRMLSPTTSSVGRLFDGVAAILFGMPTCDYEGELAMRMESVRDEQEQQAYTMPLQHEGVWLIDWRPMIRQLVRDKTLQETEAVMSMRFHRGLANAVCELVRQFPEYPVVCSGGVFQNRTLSELIAAQLNQRSEPVGFAERVPPNDGGLAVGQLAIALSTERE